MISKTSPDFAAELADKFERVSHDAHVLACEWWSGQPWDTLKQWQREDAIEEAIARVNRGAGRL